MKGSGGAMRVARAGSWLGLAALAWSGCVGTKAAVPDKEVVEEVASVAKEPAFADVAEPSDAPAGAEEQGLLSTITKVTVYSDRALVTREAAAEVTPTPTIFAFKKLPGWVDDGSVRVSTSAGRIVDVQVRRDFLARATDKSYLEAEDKHMELASRLAALDDELRIMDAQKLQIEAIKAFSLEKISKDTVVGDVNVESYGKVIAFISDSLRKTAETRRGVQMARNRLAPEVEASMKNLNELKSLMQLEETTVLVTLQSSQAAQCALELTYMMPGATWEPMHELRVGASDPESVEVTSFAVVTQTSGEDWGSAEMSFSTQSSTEAVNIPELEALTLGDTEAATRIMTRQVTSFQRAQSAFEGQNMMWNKMNSSASARHNFEQVYKDNYDYLQVVQSKTVQLFQALHERGTTAHFKAEVSAPVRGDGNSVRLRIGRSRLKATQKIYAAPEESLNAARTLEMINSGSQPFLPGRVSLYQDGAFLGMTDLKFIAEGERFAMFLNVADQLKLSRKMDRKLSDIVRKKNTRMKVAFVVTVENLSGQEMTLTLADRIPVSENKEIKIDNVRISPEASPDSKGLLSWSLTLKPKETRRFEISYQIEYPPTLVLETKEKRSRMPKQQMDAPSPMKRYDLEEQIMHLEDNFQ